MTRYGFTEYGMVDDDEDGDWVKFEDVAKILKDAERYRWLRSANTGPSMIEIVSDDCNPPSVTLKCEEELDSAIDAVIEQYGEK